MHALAALCGFLMFPFAAAASGAVCDIVAVCGAVADNKTNSAPAISSCVAPGGPCGGAGSTLTLPAGASFLVGSVDLSNTVGLTVRFGAGAGLFGSADSTLYPLQTQLPPTNMPDYGSQWRALLYARNVSGLTLEGPPSAVVDGLGWPWWSAFNNGSLAHQRPKLVEIVDGTDVVLRGLTFRNSPFWTLHTLYCSRVSFLGLSVFAPRAVGNTDGIDPDSCTDVLIDSCFIDVGDDGISLKSDFRVDPVTGSVALLPTARVHIVNTTVLSRNVAIGSSTYGNITDVLMEGGRIGDDEGSSPWALHVKTHTPAGGVVRNITLSAVTIGAIAPNSWQMPHGGRAFIVGLSPYNNPPMPPGAPPSAASDYAGITLRDIHVKSAVSAGSFTAVPPFHVHDVTLHNVTFGNITGPNAPWSCSRVAGVTATGVVPPLPPDCSSQG